MKIKNFIMITRANFLLASLVPLIFGLICSLPYNSHPDFNLIIAVSLGAISCHIAANVFNDYFDWISGNDQNNYDFIPNISGGSQVIKQGIATKQELFYMATFSLTIATICAVYISYIRGPFIMFFCVIGAMSAYYYTAPPLRLAARYGLGELTIFLCFGPLFITGVIYALTGIINIKTCLLGFPLGFFITSIITMNEYPDLEADKAAKKINLAVILGPQFLPFAVIAFISFAYIFTMIAIWLGFFSKWFYLTLLTSPLAIKQSKLILKITMNRNYMIQACINNLKLYTYFGITSIISALFSFVY